MFRCKACQAKDDEIRWLRHRVEELERIQVEAEKPGLLRQIEAADRPKRPTPPEKVPPRRHTMPGYEPAPMDEVTVE